jgi:hypothetical protein
VTELRHMRVTPIAQREQTVEPDVIPGRFTNLTVHERCPDCAWPDTCAKDRTCWDAEAAYDPQPTRIFARQNHWTGKKLK